MTVVSKEQIDNDTKSIVADYLNLNGLKWIRNVDELVSAIEDCEKSIYRDIFEADKIVIHLGDLRGRVIRWKAVLRQRDNRSMWFEPKGED